MSSDAIRVQFHRGVDGGFILSIRRNLFNFAEKKCILKNTRTASSMASGKAEKQRSHRKTWRKSDNFSFRLLFCSCLCGKKEKQMKINEGRLPSHLDKWASGEKNVVHITVEDLGIDNTGFSLGDEDLLTLRNSTIHSFTSASACSRALKKKGLDALSSLVIQPQVQPIAAISNKQGDEAEGEFQFVSENGADGTSGSGGLLTAPIINLIPPTPFNILDGRFFDINLDECVAHSSASNGRSAAADQDKNGSVGTEESKKGFTLDEGSIENAESKPNSGSGLSDEFGDQGESVHHKKLDKEISGAKLLLSAFKVAPLPEIPKKRESIIFHLMVKLWSN
ncbi:hypothetical protein XENOCAPTIV_027548 [Xenoophorus captivus]|uniref:Uncharacterized protein n=1 Tax=Xenoophorus captivus TaxID=1517983 RepID=A0ABV0RF35_9TELE